MTNKQLAEEILQKVGGKKNINSYSHCSTRLRFDLKDKNSIAKAALERTDGVLQVMEVAGQTQVVIGSNVQYTMNLPHYSHKVIHLLKNQTVKKRESSDLL